VLITAVLLVLVSALFALAQNPASTEGATTAAGRPAR